MFLARHQSNVRLCVNLRLPSLLLRLHFLRPLQASPLLLRLRYRRRPAAPAAAFFASLSGRQGDHLAPRRLGFLLSNRPFSSSSNNSSSSSSTSSSASSSSTSSGSDNNGEKTVSEVKAEVEQMSKESMSNKDPWGNRGKLLYEGSMSQHVRGLKRCGHIVSVTIAVC